MAIISVVFAAVVVVFYVVLQNHSISYTSLDTRALAFYLGFGIVIMALASRLPPIQMVDPQKIQLGTQQVNAETIAQGNYDAPYCDNCGVSTDKALFCPNCGMPTSSKTPTLDEEMEKRKVVPPKTREYTVEKVEDNTEEDADETTLVPVTIEGSGFVPQGQIQQLKITKVTMGKRASPNTEARPVRKKTVKQVTPESEPPVEQVDDAQYEKTVYER